MKIVLLMSGVGRRFVAAGYVLPKPLIRVGGKKLLEHVVGLYPGTHEYLFVCNNMHLQTTNMKDVIKKLVPNSTIVGIPTHHKGPVHALSTVWHLLRPDEPVLVSYCDFGAAWDFLDFSRIVLAGWDAAVPCYTGFHPHLLRKNKYAGVVANEQGRMLSIREKHCFTENPMDSYHSAGNYYFTKAGDMIRYAQELMHDGEPLNGEYYMSMLYYAYLRDLKKILVYPLRHFLQLGTPEDLEEYAAWFDLCHASRVDGLSLHDIPSKRQANVTIPYAMDTSEFADASAYWKEYFSKHTLDHAT